MNKGLLVLNIVLLLAVGTLFFLFFTKKDGTAESVINRPGIDTAAAWEHTPVAYFEMDSVEENFVLARQMRDDVLKTETKIKDSIKELRHGLQIEWQKFQDQRSKMDAEEIKKTEQSFFDKNQDINNIERELNQSYQEYYMNMNQGIVNKIKGYCKEFNKDRKYSYIIAKEPGLFYYTDDAYNITSELVKGLNKYYKLEKKN